MREIPEYELHSLKDKQSKHCICIPVINEGDRIVDQLKKMHELKIHELADILICDGGSNDGSLQADTLSTLGVRALLIKTGPGRLGAQLRMGYAFALDEGYEGILTIDGNNKDDPAAIPGFIEYLEKGYDYIQGSRFIRGGRGINTPFARLIAIRLIHAPLISLVSGFRFTDTTNGFRAYSRRVIEDSKLNIFRNIFSGYEILAYLTAKIPRLGYRVIEKPVTREYPVKGRVPTKISGWKNKLSLLTILWKLALGRYDAHT